jgi:hypothetical protein
VGGVLGSIGSGFFGSIGLISGAVLVRLSPAVRFRVPDSLRFFAGDRCSDLFFSAGAFSVGAAPAVPPSNKAAAIAAKRIVLIVLSQACSCNRAATGNTTQNHTLAGAPEGRF